MVSLTALVLTVVLVVVQLAMGQFSPRIVATILQDKPSQFAIGTFVGKKVSAGPKLFAALLLGLVVLGSYVAVARALAG